MSVVSAYELRDGSNERKLQKPEPKKLERKRKVMIASSNALYQPEAKCRDQVAAQDDLLRAFFLLSPASLPVPLSTNRFWLKVGGRTLFGLLFFASAKTLAADINSSLVCKYSVANFAYCHPSAIARHLTIGVLPENNNIVRIILALCRRVKQFQQEIEPHLASNFHCHGYEYCVPARLRFRFSCATSR